MEENTDKKIDILFKIHYISDYHINKNKQSVNHKGIFFFDLRKIL